MDKIMEATTNKPFVVDFSKISVKIGQKNIVSNVSFCIREGDRWVIVGPNGAGKTTILRVINGYLRPSRGKVSVLSGQFGEADLGEIRKKSGFVSSYLDNLLESQDNVLDVVVSGRYGATRLWEIPPPYDVKRARRLLRKLGCLRFEDRKISELSQGEKQRIMIARALMPEPALLTFDEPCASLDLRGRELFLRGIGAIVREMPALSMIYVTHRIEEIPSYFTHALVIKDGRSIACGEIARVLTGENLSRCFGIKIEIRRWRNRLYPIIS